MKRFWAGVVAAAAWGGLAQAAQIKVEPVNTLAAPVEYQNGMAGARSSRSRSDVALIVARASVDEKDAPVLGIAVENRGQGSFNLTPDSVEVRTDAGELVPLFTRDEFVAAMEQRARRQERKARIAMALDGMGAAMRDQPQRSNPAYAGNLNRAHEEGAAMIEAAQNLGFVAQTVEPGGRHATDLGLGPLPKGVQTLTVTVSIGGDTHTFPLRVLRYR